MNSKTKPNKIGRIEIITIMVHLLVCTFLWSTYNLKLFEIEQIKTWTNMYFFVLPLFMVGFQFRNLRNFNYYLIWTLIGVVQLGVFMTEKDNTDFYFVNGSGIDGLKALLPVLVLFQVFRQISLKIYKREIIISLQQYRMTWYEEEEKRNMTWIEVLFSILLFGTSILFCVI